MPIQRPIQSKLGSSPEHHEIAVEPKLKLQDDPNANKLVSLVKSRVKVPTKRLPSNKVPTKLIAINRSQLKI